ncbi:hypothetical protein [Dactylosporangium salmoneum]
MPDRVHRREWSVDHGRRALGREESLGDRLAGGAEFASRERPASDRTG